MNRLIVLIGNIGSGKSTVAKQYFDIGGCVIVSRDSIREMFAGGGYVFRKDLEPHIFTIERYALQLLLQKGYNVVVDETNVTVSARSRLIALGQEYDYKVVARVLPVLSKAESVARRMRGDRRGYTKETWEGVWESFDKRYQEPTLKEGFDEIKKQDANGKLTSIRKSPFGTKSRRTRND